MEWSEDKCFQLLSVYHDKELLWQPKHPQHYNKLKKQDAWEEIAQEMDTDPEECKKKMTSLLSSFRRENARIKRSRRTGTGTKDIYESSWFAFKAMMFLQDKDVPRTRVNTLMENDSDSSSSEQTEAVPVDPEISHDTPEIGNPMSPQPPETVNQMPPPAQPPRSKSKKQTTDERLDKAFRILQASATVASTSRAASSPKEESECEIFRKLVARKLQRYSPNVCSIVQEELMQILFKADRGEYNINPQSLPPMQYSSHISCSQSHSQNSFHPQACHDNHNPNSNHFSNTKPPNTNILLSVDSGLTSPTPTVPSPQSSPISQYYSNFFPNTSSTSISMDSGNSARYKEL